MHIPLVVPPFVRSAPHPPLWPPATLVSVTPVADPPVFQPLVSTSNPGFPTRLVETAFTVTVTSSLACSAPSPAVSLRTYVPASKKLTVVVGEEGSAKVTVCGPETWDHVVVRTPGGLGS